MSERDRVVLRGTCFVYIFPRFVIYRQIQGSGFRLVRRALMERSKVRRKSIPVLKVAEDVVNVVRGPRRVRRGAFQAVERTEVL